MLIPRTRQLRVALPLAAVAVAVAACGASGGYASKSSSAGPSSAPVSSAPARSPASGGDGGYGGYGGGGGGSAKSAPAAAAKVQVAKGGDLGAILVDGAGRSLYLFEKDQASTSSCYSDCAKVWPPFTSVGPASAGPGAMSSLLGTTSRTDGSIQVTYRGHPLYYYISDGNRPGSTAGEGLNQFGGQWYVLSPAGSKVDKGGW